jgi:hypothetical protein
MIVSLHKNSYLHKHSGFCTRVTCPSTDESPKVPQTDSIEELARFWDTHDLTDFKDELEEVSEPVFERRTILSVRLKSEEVEAVEQIAQTRGIAPEQLLREWILEKVRNS